VHEDWRAVRALGDGECEFLLPNGTQIDLHWDVINDGSVRPGFAVPAGELFAQSRAVDLDGLTVRTFSTVDTVLHLALHGCRSGGDRLRWLLDLQQSLLRWDGRVDGLLERAHDFRVELVLRCMLNRLSMFLGGTPVPLPRPTRAHRAWLAADTAMMTRYPPGSRHEGRPSGELLTSATRSGTARSITAIVQAAPRVARERWAIRRGWAHAARSAPL
jgi:hypothetical protein